MPYFHLGSYAEDTMMRQHIVARVAEMADALDLGSSGKPWGFDSPPSHHSRVLVDA